MAKKKKHKNICRLILKALIHIFLPRRLFPKIRCAQHARMRFKERYDMDLSNYEYELLNLRILIGNFELLAVSPGKEQLHSGYYRGRMIYTISLLGEGRIRTFYTSKMMKKFFNQKGTLINKFDMDIMRDSLIHENLNKNFAKYKKHYKLLYFDKHENQSVYKINDSEFALYSHEANKVINVLNRNDLTIFINTCGLEIREIIDSEWSLG